MGSRQWYPGKCKFMVSDSVSHVVGKRPCDRKPVKDDLCALHQPDKVKARRERLLKKHAPPTYPPDRRSGNDRREQRAEVEPSGWEPVESAPMGGMVLLWHRSWRHSWAGQVINNETGECVLDSPTPEHRVGAHFASHWRPLDGPSTP